LVTGGTGFTGYNLSKRLAKNKETVIALDIKEGFKDRLENLGVQVILGSVTDKKLVNDLVREVDFIHHIAAAWREVKLPKKVYWDVNVESNRILIEAAKKFGIRRYILTSTVGVHGSIKNAPANEEAPIVPRDYYQVAKYEGEKLTRELCEKYDLPYSIIRPAPTYGPADTRLLLLFKAIKSRKFIMLGSGNNPFHLVYIDDLVDAYFLTMEKKQALGQTYIIAGGECSTLNDFVKLIAETFDVQLSRWHFPVWPVWLAGLITEIICKPLRIEPPLFRRRVDAFISKRSFDISKAKKELEYKPKISIKKGVKLTAKWYLENGYL
jgi:nucleoside-diphosphate-sugar epimerase